MKYEIYALSPETAFGNCLLISSRISWLSCGQSDYFSGSSKKKKKEKTINPVIVLRFSTHAKGVNKKLAHNQRVIFKTSIFSPIFIFFVFA